MNMDSMVSRNLRRARTVFRRELSYYSKVPRAANIELTYRCNLRCKMCGVFGKIRDHRGEELTVEEYRHIFDQMREMGIQAVTFSGGEAFIRPDLFDIVRDAKRHGFRCNMFSNGTLVNESDYENIIESGLDKIIFSIDGVEQVHDVIRGIPGAFQKVMRTISGLVHQRQTCGVERPEIDVHMTMMKGNVASLSALHHLCSGLGVNFAFQPYSECDDGTFRQTIAILDGVTANRYWPKDGVLRFDDEDINRMREELGKLPIDFYVKLIHYIGRDDLRQGRMPIRRCYVTRNIMMINPYGDLIPCSNLDSYRTGNIRQEKLADIWNGEKYERLREKLSRRLLPLCTHCCHFGDNLSILQLASILTGRSNGW